MTDQPHNNFFTTVFSNRENMVDLLTQLLPEVADKIDIDSLELDNTSYVNEKLKNLYSDIVYNCNGKDGKATKISLLFEHKSYFVAYPRLQLADYMFSIYRHNVNNKEPLTLVIPIIFYHGETPWKYRTFTSYFDRLDESLNQYIPDFKYHVIDLTQYSDEYILSLRLSFLINSLIAFKHKSDSEYVKQQPKRIFYRLDFYANEDSTQMYIRALVIYIMASTKLKVEDMEQIVNTLPKEDNQRVKTTLENFIDKGIEIGEERGIEIGEKRGKELSKINMILKFIDKGFDVAFIVDTFEVSIKTVKLIKKCHKDNFKTKAFRVELATELLSTFKHLGNRNIAKFCSLNIEEVEELKAELLSDD
jgi:predicted transposase/invertase (TIGR01784 family)